MRIKKEQFKKIPYFSKVCSCAKNNKTKVYLVGGFLRDILSKKEKTLLDFDFCVCGNALKIAKDFSKMIKATLIVLDEEEKSYRVIVKKDKLTYYYDFTQLRGNSVEEDAALRDFTINSLLVDINDKDYKLIDFMQGRKDLKNKKLKTCSVKVFSDDPLRILRAFTFSLHYDLKIEKNTEKDLFKYKNKLNTVSGERINEELFKIFKSSKSYLAISKMADLKIIDQVLAPMALMRKVKQGGYHHLDVFYHSLETLKKFEFLCNRKLSKDKHFVDYLNKPVTGSHRRIDIIKLACLLHDIGKPKAKKEKNKKTIFHSHEKIGSEMIDEIAFKIKLSSKEKDILKKLIFWHLRPGYLADQIYPSRRAVYRFFNDTQEEGAAVILLSLADWRATRGPLIDMRKRLRHEKIMFSLVNYYFEQADKRPLKPLLNGYDIMRKFNLESSPIIGKVLRKVREEQMLGNVKNKQQAYSLAKNIICNIKR